MRSTPSHTRIDIRFLAIIAQAYEHRMCGK